MVTGAFPRGGHWVLLAGLPFSLMAGYLLVGGWLADRWLDVPHVISVPVHVVTGLGLLMLGSLLNSTRKSAADRKEIEA